MKNYIKHKVKEELGKEPDNVTDFEEEGNTIYRVEVENDTGFEVVPDGDADAELAKEMIDYQIEVLARLHEGRNQLSG